MTIQRSHPAFHTAVGEARAAADLLRAERARVAREVDAVLDGGWSGGAAEAFAGAWTDWLRAAAEVLTGLEVMGDLLADVDLDLGRTDLGAGTASGILLGRLGRLS